MLIRNQVNQKKEQGKNICRGASSYAKPRENRLPEESYGEPRHLTFVNRQILQKKKIAERCHRPKGPS